VRADPASPPPDPRDELLRRATAGAPDEATRQWLRRLLELGEPAAGGTGDSCDSSGPSCLAKFANHENGRRPRRRSGRGQGEAGDRGQTAG
jgi:hypothetical protein